MKRLPPALLLDLDDTILSMSATAMPAWEALCKRFAARLEALDARDLFAAIELSVDRFWKDPENRRWGGSDHERARRTIVADAFRRTGVGDDGAAHEMADTFSRERLSTIAPFPGALETLDRLLAHGRRLALVTNGRSKVQREKIDHFGLAPYFDCIVVEEEFGVGKPNPRVFRHALTSIGADPLEAWMVGDNLAFDVAGAQHLGIHDIWMDVRGTGLAPESEVRPDRIIRGLPELLEAEENR